MEVLLVLLLVSLSEKDPALKAHLNALLRFYREHRDLIRSLADAPAPAEHEDKKEGPPRSEESLKILEEYLKTV